tara:strand:- start:13126 stop:13257 length:132 start_codon:yes stop_codon:yes gene_type:complete
MTTLATFSSFLGTVWFIALACVASFAAGMIFKDWVLKLFNRGK